MAHSFAPEMEVVQTYLQDRCTGHGFPRCRSGTGMGGVFRRCVWLVISLGFTGYGVWQIFLEITNYYTFPKITSIDVEQPKSIPFPSVTICPVQPLRVAKYSRYHEVLTVLWILNMQEENWDWINGWFGFETYMKQEELKVKVLSDVQHVLNGFQASEFITVGLLASKLQPAWNFSSSVPSLHRLQQIRRAAKELPPRDGEKTIWNSGNAGEVLSWLNDTWNGKYFDIRKGISFRAQNYFELLLSRSMDNFRISLNTGYPNPNAQHELESWVSGLRFLYTKFSNGEMLKFAFRDEYSDRYFMYRMISPFTFSVDDVVLSCSLSGKNCNTKFYTMVDPQWKGCFHFNNEFVHQGNEGERMFRLNSTGNRRPAITVDVTGKEEGLMLKLITRTNESLFDFLSPIDGYVIALGDSATMPRYDQHVLVPNTGNTDLAVQRTEISRLDQSNGGICAEDIHFETAFPDYHIVGTYDQNICRQLLVLFEILNECGCLMSSNVMGGIIDFEQMLQKHDSCSFDALPCTEYASALASNKSVESCPPACHEVKLDIFASSSPSNPNAASLMTSFDFMESPARTLCAADADAACIESAYTTVHIFYRSNSVQMLRENLLYNANDFVANLGGLAGLYTGISLISLVELVEFIFDLLTVRVWRRMRVTHKSTFDESGLQLVAVHPGCAARFKAFDARYKELEKRHMELENQSRSVLKYLEEVPHRENYAPCNEVNGNPSISSAAN